MKRTLIRIVAAAGALALLAACNDQTTVPTRNAAPATPSFDFTTETNGSGVCMGDDATNVNNLVGNPAWVSGIAKPTDFNCTANDISIANATLARYSLISATGPFTTLTPTDTISCSPGQTVFAEVIANLHSTATERYNIGIWIPTPTTASAVTGTCTQYNLIPGTHGSTEINVPPDACGDMTSAADTVKVDLDILQLACTAGQTHLTINNCIGWQNSDQTNSRGSCGTTNIDGNTVTQSLAFRYGTLPENSSKCNCTPFAVPIEVLGKITVVKNTLGGDGAFQFTSDVGSNSNPVVTSPFTITTSGGTGSQLIDQVKPGTYHISESSLAANFDFTSVSCTANNAFASATTDQTAKSATITMGNGGDITCTFTNTKRTFLTLVKTVTNDNSGTKTLSDFPLTASGPVTISGVSGTTSVTSRQVSAGTYALSEQTQAGYTASSWTCSGASSFTGSGVTLAVGNTATCTIINNDIGPALTLVKVVTNNNGGTKTLSDFPLTAAGPVTITGVSGTTSVTNRTVNAGLYALSEQTQAGYTASSWSCTGAGTLSGSNLTLGLDGAGTTCTITNDDIGPTLTLVKTVTNDDGGTKTLSDFPLTASGPVTISGVSGTTSVTSRVVSAGLYALTEQTQAGYTASSWTCTGNGTQSGSNISLALAGSATCTINNNDNPAGLTLVKVVTNDNGGTKTLSDFPLTASGPETISGVSGTTAVTSRPVDAGTYALSEQTQAGYTASSWVCSGGSQSGANITITLGQSATCTIINNDIGPSLTLVKVVTNNNGGTKTLSDFPLTAAGPVTISGVSGTTSVTGRTVNAGVYALSEQTQSGYTAGSWSCTGNGTLSGSQLTLGLNGSGTTCTITNDDIGPTLTLVKTVTNDNGGTLTLSDFPLTAAGPVTISGVSGTTAVTNRVVNAGSYALSEQTHAGYTASSWSCNSGTLTGSNIALPLAGSATCSINNNDNAPKLIIKKVVKGAGSSFGFTATSPSSFITSPFTLNPPTDGVDSVVYQGASAKAGIFSITEDSKSGYLLTDLGCSDQTTVYDPAVTRTVTDTLSLGETVTCTFVNEAIALTTRTQGFWATHESLTNAVWFGGSVGGNTFSGVTDKTLCARTLSSIDIVLGGFWSNIAQTTDKTKRSSLDQARMRLLQQLLAAILNNAAFGSSPTLMSIANAKAAYCGTDEDLIKQAQIAMSQFNESGDNGLFTPGVSANGKQAKTDANLTFWNILP